MHPMIKTIISRRSIRAYKPDAVQDGDIEQILEAGLYAATAGGAQPWHFTVVKNPAAIQAISDASRATLRASGNERSVARANDRTYHPFHHAPMAIIISGVADARFAEVDCANATQNMTVAAHALGLGTCYMGSIGLAFEGEGGIGLAAELGIPEGYKAIFALALGDPEGEPRERAPRKEDTVNWVR